MKYWDKPCNPITGNFCNCELEDHCWARTGRFKSSSNEVIWQPEKLKAITLRGKPQVYFFFNTCDIGHEAVKDEYLRETLDYCNKVNYRRCVTWEIEYHTFLFLTKYPANILSVFHCQPLPFHTNPNIFIGTTITGLRPDLDKARLEALKQFKEAGFKTWVSYEPALAPVPYLEDYLPVEYCENCHNTGHPYIDTGNEHAGYDYRLKCDCKKWGIDQVIVGGESGKDARPMHPDWAREIRDMCEAVGVPYFFKQWGEWFPRSQWKHNPDLILPDDHYAHSVKDDPKLCRLDDEIMHRVGLKPAGRNFDGIKSTNNDLIWRK